MRDSTLKASRVHTSTTVGTQLRIVSYIPSVNKCRVHKSTSYKFTWINTIIINFLKLLNIDCLCYSARRKFFIANLDTNFWARDLKQAVLFDCYPSFLRFMETEASNSEKELSFDSNNLLHAIYMYAGILLNFNPLNPELNPICYLLALLAHHFLHVSRIRVKSLTIRLLMAYIYGAPIPDVSRSHTTTHHSR